jgi:putative DNA primase/helicase
MMKFTTSIADFLKGIVPYRQSVSVRRGGAQQASLPQFHPIGFNDFLELNVSPREMLLDPILPERSLAMLYAPRGVGKTLLGLSIGLAVASGSPLLRWSAPRPRRVLYVDGEMPLVSLQERLRAISIGLDAAIPNDGFRILAADQTDDGISLGTEDGQKAIEPLLDGIDLLILDNLSTLCTTGSESASDTWVPMQNWLLGLRRKGIAVLLVHHAGTNGRQRGTSRREDALDTVIALRRPEDYSPEEGARFEVHFEKLRNRVEGDGAAPFEARLETVVTDAGEGVRWSSHGLRPPIFKRAVELFREGRSVRGVAAALRISKSESGRLRLRASDAGMIVDGDEVTVVQQNAHGPILVQG